MIAKSLEFVPKKKKMVWCKILIVLFLNYLSVSHNIGKEVCLEVGGLIASVYTPVDENGNLSLGVVLQYVQFITDNNIDGVLIAGEAGEGTTLTVAEAIDLIDAWLNVARPRNIKVVVQIGGRPFADIITLAEYAEEAGVDAILTLPDLFYRPTTPEELVFFMDSIAKAAPSTPLLYYDTPLETGVNVDIVEFVNQATYKISTFKGLVINNCDDNIRVNPILQDDQKLFIVNVTYLVPAIFFGIDNFILGELNFFPDLVKEIIDTGKEGDVNATRDLYEELVDLSNTLTSIGEPVASSKFALPLITGIDAGPPRAPEIPLDDDEQSELKQKIKDKGIRIIIED